MILQIVSIDNVIHEKVKFELCENIGHETVSHLIWEIEIDGRNGNIVWNIDDLIYKKVKENILERVK